MLLLKEEVFSSHRIQKAVTVGVDKLNDKCMSIFSYIFYKCKIAW